MDTWGPDYYFYRDLAATERIVSAIMIGGGSVKPVSGTADVLHWSRDILTHHHFPVTFDAKAKGLIRQDVKANATCNFNLEKRWLAFIEHLENLGLYPQC